MTAADDPIEAYLDDLLVRLPGSPRSIRHTLAEVEAHLEDAALQAEREGQPSALARVTAVQQIGPVGGITDPGRLSELGTPARLRRLALATLLVGGAGGLALGFAGALAWLVERALGPRAIAAPFPTGSYTAADCERWLASEPTQHSCVAAMTADHASDFLLSAAACALVGLVALVAHVLLRRRWSSRAVAAALPAGTEYVAGAVLAGLAALGTAALGADAVLVTYGNAAGQYFALAVAAAGTAVGFGVLARRSRRIPVLHL